MKTLLLTSVLCLSASAAMAQSGEHEYHNDHVATVPQVVSVKPVASSQVHDARKTPIPALTDADRAAAFPTLKDAHAHGMPVNMLIRLNRLETWEGEHGGAQRWEFTAD